MFCQTNFAQGFQKLAHQSLDKSSTVLSLLRVERNCHGAGEKSCKYTWLQRRPRHDRWSEWALKACQINSRLGLPERASILVTKWSISGFNKHWWLRVSNPIAPSPKTEPKTIPGETFVAVRCWTHLLQLGPDSDKSDAPTCSLVWYSEFNASILTEL